MARLEDRALKCVERLREKNQTITYQELRVELALQYGDGYNIESTLVAEIKRMRYSSASAIGLSRYWGDFIAKWEKISSRRNATTLKDDFLLSIENGALRADISKYFMRYMERRLARDDDLDAVINCMTEAIRSAEDEEHQVNYDSGKALIQPTIMTTNRAYAKSNKISDTATTDKSFRCYICNEPGHRSKYCPSKKAFTNKTTQPRKHCSFCGKPKHTEQECWQKNPSLRPAAQKPNDITRASNCEAMTSSSAQERMASELLDVKQQLLELKKLLVTDKRVSVEPNPDPKITRHANTCLNIGLYKYPVNTTNWSKTYNVRRNQYIQATLVAEEANPKVIRGLVDSGGEYDQLDIAVIEEMNIPWVRIYNVTPVMADGSNATFPIIGKARVTVEIEGVRFENHEFLISKGDTNNPAPTTFGPMDHERERNV